MNSPNTIAFAFDSHAVRVVTGDDSEPRFVAADILATLTLDRKALERLDDDEKGVNTIHTLGGPQEVTVINESGLYSSKHALPIARMHVAVYLADFVDMQEVANLIGALKRTPKITN